MLPLHRHVKSARLQLWIAAWVLIFVHFFVQLFEPPVGNLTPITAMIDLGCLQLSALFFIASLTSFFENTRLTLGLLTLAGIPVMAYTAGLAYDVKVGGSTLSAPPSSIMERPCWWPCAAN